MTAEKYGEEWKRNSEILEAKRLEAIAYLGNKWILKGGDYTSKLRVLKQEQNKEN